MGLGNGDGAFDDATNAQTTFTYAGSGRHPVLLLVQDAQGLSHVAALDIITDNTAPVAVISAPTAAVNWSVGQTVTFSGSATDTEDGVLPASRLYGLHRKPLPLDLPCAPTPGLHRRIWRVIRRSRP